MFAELDQCGHPRLQFDVLGSILVDAHSLDEMTQPQSFDPPQVHPPLAISADLHEIQDVGRRDIGNAGQNLAGSCAGRCRAGIDGRLNSTDLDHLGPELLRPAIASPACGIDGATRRFTEVELNEHPLSVVQRCHDGIPRCGNWRETGRDSWTCRAGVPGDQAFNGVGRDQGLRARDVSE